MKILKEIKLGDEGRDFLRGHLADGNTLSRCLLEYCDLNVGEVVTHLPGDINAKEAKRFSTGGKHKDFRPAVRRILVDGKTWMTMEEKPDTVAHLAGLIREFLGKDRTLCIFEAAQCSPTDPWLRPDDERIRTLDDEVYFALGKNDAADEGKITGTIRDAYSDWHFVCVMSSLPEEDLLSIRGKILTEGDVKVMAERAEKIAVRAYDGEGFVVWDRVR